MCQSNTIIIFFIVFIFALGDRGSTVLKVMCYNSEGRWFDSRRCHWNFSHYVSWVDSASNRNEYKDYFLGVKAAGA